MSAESERRRAVPWLVVLTVLALLVRLVGIDFGVPVWEEPDPDIPIHVDTLRHDTVRANREFSERQYPHLIADLVSLLPPRPAPDEPGAPATVSEHLVNAAHSHVQSRIVVALLSVLLVPLTFLLASRFLRPWPSWFAAALVATSLLHVHFAQQARPHGAAATFFLAAVLCAMGLVRRADTRAYLACGISAGLAVGVLHSGVAVVIPLIVGYLLRRGFARSRPDLRLLLPLLLVALSIRVFYPFLFDGSEALRPAAQNSAEPVLDSGTIVWAEHSVSLSQFAGGGFRVILLSLWNYDPVLLVAAALGAAGWLIAHRRGRREGWHGPQDDLRRREFITALSFALPYLLVIGLFEKTYERFVIPLLPYLACAAAWGLVAAARRLHLGRNARVCGAALVLVLPTAVAVKLVWLRHQPDTLDQVANWIEANVEPAPDGSPVWLEAPLDVPLLRTDASWSPPDHRRRALYTPWAMYQVRAVAPELGPRWDLRWMGPAWTPGAINPSRDPGAFIDALRPGVFVIEVFERRTDHELNVRLRQAFLARGRPLARFSPEGRGNDEHPFFYQLSDHFNDDERTPVPHFVARMLRARSIGPTLEIYRLD